MTPLEEYRKLTAELLSIRNRNGGRESIEEDVHLEKMDDVSLKLSEEERLKLRNGI